MTSELFFMAVINERKIEHSIADIQNICKRWHLVTATLVSPQNTVSVYLSEAMKLLKQKGLLQENLLNRISPLGWEHINFLSDYTFYQKRNAILNSLLPLIQAKIEAGNP